MSQSLWFCNLSTIISLETSLMKKSFMSYMNKEPDDMSKEFDGLRSQIARLEKLTAEISDKQAT